MNLIEFLLKASWRSVLAAAIAGTLGGISSAAAIALINQSISQISPAHPQAPQGLLWGFVGLVAITLITNLISQFVLVQLAQDAIYKLRLRISGWILASPLRHLEELGANRLLATLTEDIQAISNAVFNIPALFVNAALICAALIYLGWLSIWVLLGTIIFLVVAISLVQLLINRAVYWFTQAREENDALMQHFRAITDGVKELKLHSTRRDDFLEQDLETTAAALRNYRIGSQRAIALSTTLGDLLLFVLFSQATHTYRREGEESTFALGPIDLTIQPGELIFIVGGNGSGKSTLAKLITGLYIADSGQMRWDDVPIDDRNRESYRQLFSTVFADFYLFDRLVGIRLEDPDEQAKIYLEKLQLDHKVEVRDGKLSTTALSQGQRKRLALLTAYLEDRPIYLFDEWAADQDPFFREVFYQQLLPELQQRGKAVLVISHDDRYFHLADRLVKLDYGKIVVSEI